MAILDNSDSSHSPSITLLRIGLDGIDNYGTTIIFLKILQYY